MTVTQRRWSTPAAVVTARVVTKERRTVSIIPTGVGRNEIFLDSATAITDFNDTVRLHLDEIAFDRAEEVVGWIESERRR